MRIHRHRQRKPKLKVQTYRTNKKIDAEEVRVVGDEGEIGIMPTEKALALAEEKELDLVEVSPKANPPVCKILDYGQFKYQKEKEARKQKAQSKEVDTKGIRLSVRIGDHDLAVRRKQACKFLDRGDKLKIELVLRGREKAHKNVAKDVVKNFIESLREDYDIRIESHPKYQGGRINAIIARNG